MAFRQLVWLVCIAAALWPQVSRAQNTAEQAIAEAHRQYSLAECGDNAAPDEIVVCADDPAKYRLPLPIEPSPQPDHIAGELPRASSELAPYRPCGVFRGQRRCNIKELREYGYGGGSVPIRVLVMLAKKVVDPETELGPPGGYPIDPGTGK